MPRSILLVEDDPTMLSLLKTFLQIEGYEVFLADAETWDCLLTQLEKKRPDLILLDVNLRYINGIEIIKKIRGHKDFNDIEVIMTSGIDCKNQCLKEGANRFILKPYMPDDLLTVLAGSY
jgi:DNA-binding response OmpR family regulator